MNKERKILLGSLAVAMTVLLTIVLLTMFASSKQLLIGGCSERSSPFMKQYFDDDRRISFCDKGDANEMRIESAYFKPRSGVSFSYAGYPNTSTVRVFLEGSSGKQIPLDLKTAGETWQPFHARVPEELKNDESIRLVAIDGSTGFTGWIGIGRVESTIANFNLGNLAKLLIFVIAIHLVVVLWLTILMRYLMVDIAALWLIIALGFLGWLLFGAYYVGRIPGMVLSYTALLLAIGQGVSLLSITRFKPPALAGQL